MSYSVALEGCVTEPMGSYLKALAVFRLVSEQGDSGVSGCWRGNTFCLSSELDQSGLVGFFLDRYHPTPIVAPWNGGSGFSEGDRHEGLDAILESDSPKFSNYRRTIREIFSWAEIATGEMIVSEMISDVQRTANALRQGKARTDLLSLIADFDTCAAAAGLDRDSVLPLTVKQLEKAARPLHRAVTKLRTAAKKSRRAGGKEEIVRACRNRLGDGVVDWLDSAVVLRSATDLNYPPILGTGGAEGRLDYTNSFMERVTSVLLGPRAVSENLLRNALFAENSDQFSVAPVGQLDPGRAGGYNQGPEIETKNFPTNPWDFVLAMEGAVAWASGAGRRQAVTSRGVMSSPFTVRSRAVGYSSARDKDEGASRAEVWMPIWTRPCGFEELRTLLREGRAEWGGRLVENAVEFAEAAASLGTDRGIEAFQRFSIIKRRGDSFLALPIGRIPVTQRRDADLLRQVDPLLNRIDSFERRFKSEIPAQFRSLRRQIDTAIYQFALHGGGHRLRDILAALGRTERYFAARDLKLEPRLERPLSGLSVDWLRAADIGGSIELRIASALASIGPCGSVGGIRANLAPVDPGPARPDSWVQGSGQIAWYGNSLAERMTNVLKRRMMDAERLNRGGPIPLRAAFRIAPEDVASFLAHNSVDDSLIEDLFFCCTLIDWLGDVPGLSARPQEGSAVLPRNYALLKQLFDGNGGSRMKPEPDILLLLSAGRTSEACSIAQRRLRASGSWPARVLFPNEPDGFRLAASLLIPVHSMDRLSRLVLHPQE